MRTYLDYAASAPLWPQALEAMLPHLTAVGANPAASYETARDARKALEQARARIAGLLGAKPHEIYFTSGGTESDNWALRGLVSREKPHIVTTMAEHHAILDTCDALENEGYEVTRVGVNAYGAADAEAIEETASKETALISVMYANNETGAINDVSVISRIAAEKKIPFHTDAVAACGHIPIHVDSPHVDLLSVSAHKFGGPLGIGALYIREGTPVAPFMCGGSQERHRRAGTQNVAAAVGMAEAFFLSVDSMDKEAERLRALKTCLRVCLSEQVPDVVFTTPDDGTSLPGTLHFLLPGVLSEAALVYLDRTGFSCAAGSACTTGSAGPSHVMLACGYSRDLARCALRVSMGRQTMQEDINRLGAAIRELAGRRRTRTKASSTVHFDHQVDYNKSDS